MLTGRNSTTFAAVVNSPGVFLGEGVGLGLREGRILWAQLLVPPLKTVSQKGHDNLHSVCTSFKMARKSLY